MDFVPPRRCFDRSNSAARFARPAIEERLPREFFRWLCFQCEDQAPFAGRAIFLSEGLAILFRGSFQTIHHRLRERRELSSCVQRTEVLWIQIAVGFQCGWQFTVCLSHLPLIETSTAQHGKP